MNQTSFYFSITSLNKGSSMSALPLPLPRCTDVDHSSICVVDPMYDTPERLRPCILPRQECFLLFYYIRNPKYRIIDTFKQEYSYIPNWDCFSGKHHLTFDYLFCNSEFFHLLGRKGRRRVFAADLRNFISRHETAQRMETSSRGSSEKRSQENRQGA